MAQPICVMYVPRNYSLSPGAVKLNPARVMNLFNGWEKHSSIKEPLGGYLWFCFYKEGITEPELKTFYDTDFTPLQYDELKELVMKGMSELDSSKN